MISMQIKNGVPIGLSNSLIKNSVGAKEYFDPSLECNSQCSAQLRQGWDANYMKHVGYDENNMGIQALYSPANIANISKKITQLLEGVHPDGRPIVVTDEVITGVMSNVQVNFNPIVGSIYNGRDQIDLARPTDFLRDICDRTINVVVGNVRNEYEVEKNNFDLSIWDATLLGSFNRKGLRQHPPIKIRNNHPQLMMFNMHY